eukprot:1161479-Pelagomonas_calceolata.AAC.2
MQQTGVGGAGDCRTSLAPQLLRWQTILPNTSSNPTQEPAACKVKQQKQQPAANCRELVTNTHGSCFPGLHCIVEREDGTHARNLACKAAQAGATMDTCTTTD